MHLSAFTGYDIAVATDGAEELHTIVKMIPMVHMRTVFTGNEMSSTGCTTARTSGKGESAASYGRIRCASPSLMIL